MCGIIGFKGCGDKYDLERMTSSLNHRGPDDSGVWFDGSDKIGFGHTRLSILDLSPAGHQPMVTHDDSLVITFNGEIYNHEKIRKNYLSRYQFKSTSDTETILYAYKELGEKCFELIEGMFALALYDKREKKLILARDRMGKKPLFWARFKDNIIFGSELKALYNHPCFFKEIDISSLNKYLQYDYIPTPHTIWKNVFKLEPATYVVIKGNNIKKVKYWNPVFDEVDMSFSDAIGTLDRLISDAVEERLVADVPVGVFLSGGLDSSTILYYAKRMKQDIETFSIGFREKSFDESAYAEKVAKTLGSKHRNMIFGATDCIDVIETVLPSVDEPMADASIIPTYLLSNFVRKHVIVALGGDGGDELFSGYPTFIAHKMRNINIFPESFVRRSLDTVGSFLPASGTNFSIDFKIKSFTRGLQNIDSRTHEIWLGSYNEEERSQLFRKDIWNSLKNKNVFEDSDRNHDEHMEMSNENKILYQYERGYLMDEVMVKVDRASMLNSLEARSPLLDQALVEFANKLPYKYKFHGLTTKYILKQLMKDRLPKDIVYRKKKGFGMPVAEWINGSLKNLFDDVLSKRSVEGTNLFDSNYIDKLLSDHRNHVSNNRKQLWNIFVFLYWWRNFNI